MTDEQIKKLLRDKTAVIARLEAEVAEVRALALSWAGSYLLVSRSCVGCNAFLNIEGQLVSWTGMEESVPEWHLGHSPGCKVAELMRKEDTNATG